MNSRKYKNYWINIRYALYIYIYYDYPVVALTVGSWIHLQWR